MASVLLGVSDGVATITLNEPERRNPMTPAIMDGVADAVATIRARDDVGAVIITGAPPAFCAGADLRARVPPSEPGDPAQRRDDLRAFYARFLCVADLDVPTIAAVNGAAVGGGLGLALCADIRIFAQDAKLAVNFAKLGIHPGMATTYHLPRAIGRSAAAELFFTGRFFDGREAERLGLGRAVPAEEVLPAAQAVAREIAGNDSGLVRAIKRALRLDGTRDDSLEYEMAMQMLRS